MRTFQNASIESNQSNSKGGEGHFLPEEFWNLVVGQRKSLKKCRAVRLAGFNGEGEDRCGSGGVQGWGGCTEAREGGTENGGRGWITRGT